MADSIDEWVGCRPQILAKSYSKRSIALFETGPTGDRLPHSQAFISSQAMPLRIALLADDCRIKVHSAALV